MLYNVCEFLTYANHQRFDTIRLSKGTEQKTRNSLERRQNTMKKTKLESINTVLTKVNDLLIDYSKSDLSTALKSDSTEDLLSAVHYTIESPRYNDRNVFKTYRCTIENSQVVANKVLFTEKLRKRYNVTCQFEKSPSKNYFCIKYKDIDTLESIIKDLRNNYYEFLASTYNDDITAKLTIKTKKTTAKKTTTKAVKKTVKATK